MGPPSVLVNNAVGLDARYAVNLRATALVSVIFARGLRGTRGRIVNLTSGRSLGLMPGELAYDASRDAIEAFTRTPSTPWWATRASP